MFDVGLLEYVCEVVTKPRCKEELEQQIVVYLPFLILYVIRIHVTVAGGVGTTDFLAFNVTLHANLEHIPLSFM